MMLFNSIDFAIFLPAVFILYWFVFGKNQRAQNIFLLIAGYAFYSFSDVKLLYLLFGISFTAYVLGLLLDRCTTILCKRILLIFGIALLAGVLSVFKFLNFSKGIVLPLGISFYTFLSLSYIFDIYLGRMKACKDPVDALLTLSYFPILLAGPVQRPALLLPQIRSRRVFEYDLAAEGMRQILWGLFMKIMIADNCAVYADDIFTNYASYGGSTLLIGAVLYTIQIYADFAGYSEIATGVSKLFGIRLVRNFSFPYFASDIADFWKRWHISLTTWFRDYVFLPLSFSLSRRIPAEKFMGINTEFFIYTAGISVTWLLTGIWHGSGANYIVWGLFHGTLLIIYHALRKPKKKARKLLKNKYVVVTITERLLTVAAIIVSWIIFRTESLSRFSGYISGIFSNSLFSKPEFSGIRRINPLLISIAVLFIVEWSARKEDFALKKLFMKRPGVLRWTFYLLTILSMYFFGNFSSGIEFIYFKF